MTTPENDDRDLILERLVPALPERLYEGWTNPDLMVQWFTPAPWMTTEAEVDPRPGGIFRTEMRGPNGEEGGGGSGCVLEAVPGRRLVWTSALGPGFHPHEPQAEGFAFTAIIEFEPAEDGTLYRATARHATAANAQTHAAMGFEAGWGAALDQLVRLVGSESGG